MPLERWTAYMTSVALSMGYRKEEFSIGTFDGESRITIYTIENDI